MTRWIRFAVAGGPGLGTLDGVEVQVFEGDLFAAPRPTGTVLPRAEIGLRLWGNLSFGPFSSLAHATLLDICRFTLTHEPAADMRREAQAVAHKLGIGFRVSLERRIAGAESVSRHKTSMLQAIEAGRAPEGSVAAGVQASSRSSTWPPP